MNKLERSKKSIRHIAWGAGGMTIIMLTLFLFLESKEGNIGHDTIVDCGDNRLAGEIDGGVVTYDDGSDFRVVSGSWALHWVGTDHTEYFDGEKATKKSFCTIKNPTQQEMIQQSKSKYEQNVY